MWSIKVFILTNSYIIKNKFLKTKHYNRNNWVSIMFGVFDMIDYNELLKETFLYPYWQRYNNGINIFDKLCDDEINCSFNYSHNILTFAASNDNVS